MYSKVVSSDMLGLRNEKEQRPPGFLTQLNCTAELVTLRIQPRLYKPKASISPNQVIFLQKNLAERVRVFLHLVA